MLEAGGPRQYLFLLFKSVRKMQYLSLQDPWCRLTWHSRSLDPQVEMQHALPLHRQQDSERMVFDHRIASESPLACVSMKRLCVGNDLRST